MVRSMNSMTSFWSSIPKYTIHPYHTETGPRSSSRLPKTRTSIPQTISMISKRIQIRSLTPMANHMLPDEGRPCSTSMPSHILIPSRRSFRTPLAWSKPTQIIKFQP